MSLMTVASFLSQPQGEVQWRSTPFSAGVLQIPQQVPRSHQVGPRDFLFGISRHGQAIAWTSCLFEQQGNGCQGCDQMGNPSFN